MHMVHIHMICILTTSGHHPVFFFLNSPWGILFWGQLQWMMAFWLQHPLFTEIASEIFVPKEKLKRRLEIEMSFSVTQSCPTLCNTMECTTLGFLILHHLPEFVTLMSTELVMPSNHLILCCPLLLLPSILTSIRVFSSESALCIRLPKYWRLSFSISPSNEYSRLISFWID